MKFDKRTKQRIIDDYLNQSGENLFVPERFIEWLRDRPDHPAFTAFYGISDGEAATAYRVDLARKWVSGLRISVRVEEVVSAAPRTISVQYSESTATFPALISPTAQRSNGGGYLSFDPADPRHMAELQRQAGEALRAWLERYRSAAEAAGIDCNGMDNAARVLMSAVAVGEDHAAIGAEEPNELLAG